MSIILDALKKAERERAPEGKEVRPPIPALVLRESGKGSSLPLVAVVGILIVALVGAVLFLAPLGKKWIVTLRQAQGVRSGHGEPVEPQPATPPMAASDATALKTEALELFNKGDYEGSLTVWQKVTAALPSDFESVNNLGFVLKKLNRPEEARTAYEKAIAINTNYAVAFNNLGVLFMEEGDPETAQKNLERAVELNASYPDPHLHLALLFEKQRKPADAAAHFRTFLEQSPALPPDVREKIISKLARLNGGS